MVMGPFGDSQAPSWLSGPRIDVLAKPSSHRSCMIDLIFTNVYIPNFSQDVAPFFLDKSGFASGQ